MSDRWGGAVVVGIDGSDSAREATRWAAAEAVRRGTRLRLVAAVAWGAFRPVGVPGLGQEHPREIVEREAGLHLAAAARTAAETAPDLRVETEVRGGGPPVVLADESARAALVVLGSRGRGGFASLVLGSVAVTVAAHAGCPVVVVRGTPATGPVVAGLADAGDDDQVLDLAFEYAASRGVSLVAVHAVNTAVLDPFLVPLLDWQALRAEEEHRAAERVAAWSAKYPSVEVITAIVMDGAARELVARSHDAGLVVVGSRGRGTVGGPLLGSVGQAVLHHAECPVAVVRPAG